MSQPPTNNVAVPTDYLVPTLLKAMGIAGFVICQTTLTNPPEND